MLLLLLASLAAQAAPSPASEARARASEIGWKRDLGVGVALGQGIGPTVKYYIDRRARHALDASLMVHGFSPGPALSLHGGWSVHPTTLVSSHTVELPLRLGLGGFVGYNGRIDPDPGWFRPPFPDDREGYLGLRGVLGADADLVDLPLQLYVDVSPSLTLLPRAWLSFSATIGARWYL